MPEHILMPTPRNSHQAEPISFEGVANFRYALITPVRDEEAYIGDMIDSIVNEPVLPTRWIIVDDGSRDKTAEIISEYACRFNFIQLVTLPAREQRLAGGEGAIPVAMRTLDVSAFDFLGRFDADLVFPPGYIARILAEFQRNPALGIAGGMLYVERDGSLMLEANPDFHVRGAVKMYRRQCFIDIGGLTTQIGWDTIDEVLAWSKGWTTRSFPALRVLHRRPTGHGIAGWRVYRQRGHAEYFTWSHPLHVLARSLRVAWIERSLIKPCCYLLGYFESMLCRAPRIQDPVFIHTRRAQQLRRLAALVPFGGRLTSHAAFTHSRPDSVTSLKG